MIKLIGYHTFESFITLDSIYIIMTTNSDGNETKRIMITVLMSDYEYCRSHFVKISAICSDALTKYIKWEQAKMATLKTEIPPLVDQPHAD